MQARRRGRTGTGRESGEERDGVGQQGHGGAGRECGADLFEVEVEYMSVDGVEVGALADEVGGPALLHPARNARRAIRTGKEEKGV